MHLNFERGSNPMIPEQREIEEPIRHAIAVRLESRSTAIGLGRNLRTLT